jgi:biopolymer transport protein ExbD
MGLQVSLPTRQVRPLWLVLPETISVGLASDGSLWINQSAVKLDDLRGFFLNVSWLSALIVLIFQGDGSLEFGAVAHVTVVRRFAAGPATSELEKNR